MLPRFSNKQLGKKKSRRQIFKKSLNYVTYTLTKGLPSPRGATLRVQPEGAKSRGVQPKIFGASLGFQAIVGGTALGRPAW